MKTSNVSKAEGTVFFLLGVVVLVTFILLPIKDRTVVNGFTLFGTFFSLVGLWLAYSQIKNLSSRSQEIQSAVEESFQRVNQILSVSDLSKAYKIIHETQQYLQTEKYELALLRMKDLKGILIQFKFNKELMMYTDDKIYNTNITDLGSDLNNLTEMLYGKKSGLNFSKMNQNLENLATTITEFENKLKYTGHDPR